MSFIDRIAKLKRSLKDTISVSELFTSQAMYDYLDKFIQALTGRYADEKTTLIMDSGIVAPAATNYDTLLVNIYDKLFATKVISDKLIRVKGAILHEIGHILFTDFELCNKCVKHIKNTNSLLYANASSIEEYLKDGRKTNDFLKIYNNLDNILEDGYVDINVKWKYIGYADYLSYLRNISYNDMMSFEDYVANGDSDYELFEFLLLSYAVYGKINMQSSSATHRVCEALYNEIHLVDEYLASNNSIDRRIILEQIIIDVWNIIKEHLDTLPVKENKSSKSAPKGNKNNNIQQGQRKRKDKASKKTNDSSSESKAESSTTNDNKSSSANTDENKCENANSKSVSKETEHNSANTDNSKESKETSSNATNSTENKKDNSKKSASKETSNKIMSRLSNSPQNIQESTSNLNAVEEEKAVNKLLDDLATGKAESKCDSEDVDQLVKEINKLSFGNIHDCAKLKLSKADYNNQSLVSSDDNIKAKKYAELSARKVNPLLTEKRKTRSYTGLSMGKRIDRRSFARMDNRIFKDTRCPSDIPELGVLLLVDMSGSMRDRDKIKSARNAALTLYDFCKSLEIPVSVYGHNTSGSTVNIVLYADAELDTPHDRKRICTINYRGANRDGYAISVVGDRLKKLDANNKLLIVISDGLPSATAYHGTEAIEDTKLAIRKLRRENIIVVGAAIDADKDTIRDIYGKGFMDLSNLENLPKELTSIVKHHLP